MTDDPDDPSLIALGAAVSDGAAVDWGEIERPGRRRRQATSGPGDAGRRDARRGAPAGRRARDERHTGRIRPALAAPRALRARGRGRIRHGLPRLGPAPRARSRRQASAQIAAQPAFTADRSAPPRTRPPLERRRRPWRRSGRRAGRHLDGVHRGADAGRDGPRCRTDECARGDRHRDRSLPRAGRAARRRPAAPRHQGAQRHARARRPNRPDGLQRGAGADARA